MAEGAQCVETVVGWGVQGLNKICTKPRVEASRLGVYESSGELVGGMQY